MDLTAKVQNDKILQDNIEQLKKIKNGSKLGKDDFLQILVAQAKYQDPMTPTDNTAYISQLATFSTLEQMQNMAASLENLCSNTEKQNAFSMVGKNVTVNDTLEISGQISGKVESASIVDKKAYIKINGKNYLASDVQSIDAE